jgi:hypothetical protein
MPHDGSPGEDERESDPPGDDAEESGFRFHDDAEESGFRFHDDAEESGFQFGDGAKESPPDVEADATQESGDAVEGSERAAAGPEGTDRDPEHAADSREQPVDEHGAEREDSPVEFEARADAGGGGEREASPEDEPSEDHAEPEEPYVEFVADVGESSGTERDDDGAGRDGDEPHRETEASDDGAGKSRLERERELQEMTLEEQFEAEQEESPDGQRDERDDRADEDERTQTSGSAHTSGSARTTGQGETPGNTESDGSETDPGLAGILSFLVPGVGNFYSGQTARGAVWLVAWLAWLVVGWGAGGFIFGIILGLATYGLMFVLTFVVLVAMELVLHAVAAYDGYNQAGKINDGAVQV